MTKALLLAMSALAATTAGAEPLLYTLKQTVTLPSTNTDWDYIRMEPGSSRLFIARDKDGLTVFDVDKHRAVATVPDSVGANGPLLLPQYDRGYVAMTDGSLLSFALKSLKPLWRRKLSPDGGLNSGIHDPSTKRLHFITSTRPKESVWYSFEAASGRPLGSKAFPFRKMDDPAFDGRGSLFAPVRYDEVVLKLSSDTLREEARWTVGCRVSKLRYQSRTGRLVGACGGEKPQVFIMNSVTGEVTARVPIGKGVDALVIDESRNRIITANGEDGTLSVLEQRGPDQLQLLGTVGTRIGARMMDMDVRTGSLLLVNADFTMRPSADGNDPIQIYHPNSFNVLRYEVDSPTKH